MTATASRRCRSCSRPLASDNRAILCGQCQRKAREALDKPPDLPPEFWESGGFADAFAAQHIGRVSRAYRRHPFHTAPHGANGISQAVIGSWLGLTQAQVSRIENGPATRNLDILVHWARTLRIPRFHLWFELPDGDADGPQPAHLQAAGVSNADVSASQHEWRLTRRHLNARRSDLARAAAGLYRPDTRLRATNLLTLPAWMPHEPVALDRIVLEWREGPSTTTVDGTGAVAQILCPLRSPGLRFERYTSAIRYVDPPTLFENRPSYRLLDLAWDENDGNMTFGLATYFDKLDVSEALGHEFARAVTELAGAPGDPDDVTWARLPYRRLAGDPFDLASRAVVPAITTLTLIRQPSDGTASFVMHWRDPAKVATAGGQYDVIPAGEFQPSSVAPWSHAADLDLWRNVVREYSEELCGTPEHDGSRSTPIDYDRWPFYRTMTRHRDAGRIRAYCFGVGLDALTLAATIPTVFVFDDDAFAEVFGEVVQANAEGVTVTSLAGEDTEGIPFTEANVRRFLTEEPMAPPGAACLALAWEHRAMLLGGPM
jgi:hypothetical protein